jgi:phosphoserine phosphatase
MNFSNTYKSIYVFDLDGTLIKDNIGTTFVKFLLRKNKIKLFPLILLYILYPLIKIKVLSFKYGILLGVWALKGLSVDSVSKLAEQCFNISVKENIFKDGIQEVKDAKDRENFVILATGAHYAIAKLFADYLDVDLLISTKSVIVNNQYTLKAIKPLPFKEGKMILVKKFINSNFKDARVFVYADDEKDLALISYANVPIAINADTSLKKYVKSRNGIIKEFK